MVTFVTWPSSRTRSENPIMRLRSRWEKWSRSWHDLVLEQSFYFRKRSITTFLLKSGFLRGSDSKGKLSRSLPNTSTFVPNECSQCLHGVPTKQEPHHEAAVSLRKMVTFVTWPRYRTLSKLSCHERDHFSQRDCSLMMGFSLSPMHNSMISPENSNGRVRLGNLKNMWLLIQAIHEVT